MAVSVKTRHLSRDNLDSVYNIAEACAEKHGHNFIGYSEEKEVRKAPIAEKMILRDENLEFLEMLRPLCDDRLHFVRSDVKKIMTRIAGKYSTKWSFSKCHIAPYILVMTNRWMNLCHNVSCSEDKKKKPKWVRLLPWRREDEDEDSTNFN